MAQRLFVGVAALAAVVGIGLSAGSAAGQTYQFDYSGAIVNWVVPTTGIYRVTAVGGQGGGVEVSDPQRGPFSTVGGSGARVAGTVTLNAGTTLQIAVAGGGSLGGNIGSGNGGGGGGGSFVVAPGDTPLIVAGGGGGASFVIGQLDSLPPSLRRGQDARLTQQAGFDTAQAAAIGFGGRLSRGVFLGNLENGPATGGAGFYGDSQPLSGIAPPIGGGIAYGWPSLLPGVNGGFGGGGGLTRSGYIDAVFSSGTVGVGGGGGGYTGGGGGGISVNDYEITGLLVDRLTGGFGAGSFASSLATDTLFELASDRTGNGVVTIEFLAVPGPSVAVVVAMGGVMAGRRRR
jgi:hypothetical protein